MDDKWYFLALRYLQYRPRSTKEIRDYLTKKKAPVAQIDTIIAKLQEQKFLNDKEFAQMWVRTRAALKPTGKHLLKVELIKKGISTEIIDSVIAQSQEESGTDLEMAKILLKKKKDKFKNLPREKLFKKAGGFLQRRGFDYETIKKALIQVGLL